MKELSTSSVMSNHWLAQTPIVECGAAEKKFFCLFGLPPVPASNKPKCYPEVLEGEAY